MESGSQETLHTGLVQRISHIITLWPSYVSKILSIPHREPSDTANPVAGTDHSASSEPIKNLLPDFATEKGKCLICKTSQRTACMACKQVYCYTCGSQHLHEILLQYTTTSTFQAEGEQSLPLHPEWDTRILPTTNVMSDNDSNGSDPFPINDQKDFPHYD